MPAPPIQPDTAQHVSAAISTAIITIRAEIAHLEQKYGRKSGSVELLAVSKTKPSALIRAAAAENQIAFGENYADEGAEKSLELKELNLLWHYIGHIQSNKTKLIASHYDWVQGVDRLKIAKRLNEHRGARPDGTDNALNICIQLKLDAEESKSGCTTDELEELAGFIAGASHLTLRGIMAIPAPRSDFAEQRAVFKELHGWYQKLKKSYATVDTLSMGMSGDMEAAIAEGATMVRIGTAVFGARERH